MQVFEVKDDTVVQPDGAYVVAPHRDMALLNGTLQMLEPRSPLTTKKACSTST